MIEIVFDYNQQITNIQAQLNEPFKEAINKYLQKSLLDPKSIVFFTNGHSINPEKTIKSQMNTLNKHNNTIKV